MSTYKYLDDNGLIYYHSKVKNLLANKVDKETGKGLSTNDYTTTEKNKLSGIASGAEVNQNAFSNVKVGSSTIAADGKTDTLELTAGTGITLTPDTTNDKVTIATSLTIPTKTSDLTNDSGFVTTTDYASSGTAGVVRIGNGASIVSSSGILQATTTDSFNGLGNNYFIGYGTLKNYLTHISNEVATNKVTSMSSSSTDVQYPSAKCVYDAIQDAIGSITGLNFEIVQTLPTTGVAGTIYLVPNSGTAPNIYDEYVWLTSTSKFEKIGTTDVDLSGYVQASDMVAITNAEIDTIVA